MRKTGVKEGCKGFSLSELMIVLVVIGLILGGVWVAAEKVGKKAEVGEAVENVQQIALNVRNLYTGFSGAPAPTPAQQIASGLFPRSLLNAAGTAAVNVWGGTYALNFVSVAGNLRGFAVLVSLPASLTPSYSREVCHDMASRIQGTGPNFANLGALAGSPPAYSAAQEGRPTTVFINNTGVTGLGLAAVNGVMGAGSCSSVAFYFPL